MAVAALVLWLCTAAVGSYLLATSSRSRKASDPPPEPVSVSAEQSAAADQVPAGVSPAPQRPLRDKDRFDPLSLQQAKSEPLPGLKDLAEFSHPTLAMIGFGFWFGYVVSRDRLFLAIALGILLGAICAGVSWFIASTRAGRRAADAAGAADADNDSSVGPLSASPRLLILHAVGAGLTLLIVALIAARG